MVERRYDSAWLATLHALRDRLRRERPEHLGPEDWLDGCTALVTGANRGLGRAVAVGLAQRGARILLACRSDASEARREVERFAEADTVAVDLSDLPSVDRLVDDLAERREQVHVLVLNAGVVPNRARRTAQGLEIQIGVNFLANVALVDQLLERGILAPDGDRLPRIVVVSSESHRSAARYAPERLDAYDDYGIGGVMRRYGESKLLLTAWSTELARRVEGRAAIYTMCPGPVATGIAHEAPRWAQALVDPIIQRFFAPADVGAQPVVYLSCARALEGRSGLYHHRWREKPPSDIAADPGYGAAIWDASHRLLERLDTGRSTR